MRRPPPGHTTTTINEPPLDISSSWDVCHLHRRAPRRAEAKSEIVGLTCGDPDWRPRPASAGTSVARTCSWHVLLLPRSERPGGSSADETTALGAAPQPPHGDICPGQVLV